MKKPHCLFSVQGNALPIPIMFANPIKRTSVPRISSPVEPNQRFDVISIGIENSSQAEHCLRLSVSRGLSIPLLGFFRVQRDTNTPKVIPAHGQNCGAIARVGRLGIQSKRLFKILRDAVALKEVDRFVVAPDLFVGSHRCSVRLTSSVSVGNNENSAHLAGFAFQMASSSGEAWLRMSLSFNMASVAVSISWRGKTSVSPASPSNLKVINSS